MAKEVLGEKPLPGVLIVDRYNAYNKMPCAIQYCYAHLQRDVVDLEKDFPDTPEVISFVKALAPQLAGAMSLSTLDITDGQFRRQATKIKGAIIDITNRQARHPAIWKIQDIFREKAERLYHWARDRNIPADNPPSAELNGSCVLWLLPGKSVSALSRMLEPGPARF